MARQKEEILFEWVCPKEVSVAEVRTRYSKFFIPRVLFITAVVWMTLCFGLYLVSPQNSGIDFVRIFVKGLVAAVAIGMMLYFWLIFESKFSRTKYKITKERVRVVGSSSRDIKWKDIIGYKICGHEELEGFSGVYLFYNRGNFRRLIGLPPNELGAQIVKYIAERVPLIEKPLPAFEIVKLSVWHKVCLFIVTGLYSLCLALYAVFYGAAWIIPFVVWVVLFLGPGTICMAFVFGRRRLSNKSIKNYVCTYNLMSLFLIYVLFFLLWFWKLKKEYGW